LDATRDVPGAATLGLALTAVRGPAATRFLAAAGLLRLVCVTCLTGCGGAGTTSRLPGSGAAAMWELISAICAGVVR
jgi:hypothetical protein